MQGSLPQCPEAGRWCFEISVTVAGLKWFHVVSSSIFKCVFVTQGGPKTILRWSLFERNVSWLTLFFAKLKPVSNLVQAALPSLRLPKLALFLDGPAALIQHSVLFKETGNWRGGLRWFGLVWLDIFGLGLIRSDSTLRLCSSNLDRTWLVVYN